MARAFLGLGSNMGDREAALAAARERLAIAGAPVVRASRLYETSPVGPVPQPDYLNQVVEVETALAPRALLAACRQIEHGLGRVRGARWGPRTLDVDILLYDGLVLDEPELVIPHPELHRRAFVLAPLAELAPGLVVRGRPVEAWLADAAGQEVRARG